MTICNKFDIEILLFSSEITYIWLPIGSTFLPWPFPVWLCSQASIQFYDSIAQQIQEVLEST